jgi:hypothetical protein
MRRRNPPPPPLAEKFGEQASFLGRMLMEAAEDAAKKARRTGRKKPRRARPGKQRAA